MINTEKLKQVIEAYKADFAEHFEEERYKWEAVKCFQDNWNINSEDFVGMLKKSLSKTYNLLASGYAYPRRMLKEFAEADSQAVKSMFIDLFDEIKDLAERIESFISYAESIRKKYDNGTWKNHYQNTNAVSTYLWLKYYKDKFTGEILVDETAAAIVKEVFEKFFAGYGLSTIAKDFNRRGIKSPEYFSHRKKNPRHTEITKRFLWAQTTVKRLIQNEAYTGTLVNHKTVTSKIYKTKDVIPREEQYRHENYMPAIIDRETFEQAQVLLESRLKNNARSKFGNVIHRYCGMIKCAECGASLIAKKRTVAGHSWGGIYLQQQSPLRQRILPRSHYPRASTR